MSTMDQAKLNGSTFPRNPVEERRSDNAGRASDMALRALSIDELEERLGISRRTIQRLVQRGEFPKPKSLGRRRVYLLEDVQSWLKK